ncbi:MAG: NAD-dependent epimerase/dehydratase family protein [Thermoanaerobaculia bacterium]
MTDAPEAQRVRPLAERFPSGAAEVVATDLSYMAAAAAPELARLAGKELLITGGAGFLGHYLVQLVVHRNAQVPAAERTRVTVYDNYARGVPLWLQGLESDPSVSLIERDITEPLPADVGDFQYVIHAAGIASPTYYRQRPIETIDANVNGLRLLLEHCRRQQERGRPVEGFLFFSSSEIYGDPSAEDIPTPESYRGNVSCTGPRACYDESKRFGETLSVTFARQYGLPIKIARPFNNYGPGLKIADGRVLPDFARDVLDGRDLVMLSDGSATRTFCYVADAVVGYYKILVAGRDGEAYNIGVEEPEITIAELAQRVAELGRDLFGYRGRVVAGRSDDRDYLVDNPNRRCPVIAKARDHLAYEPTIGLDEGLRRSLVWYTENLKPDA